MKKIIFTSVMIMLSICSALFAQSAFLSADTIVESVDISIVDDNNVSIDSISDYSKNFVDLSSPYGYFTITLLINDSPVNTSAAILQIINDLTLKINNTSISIANIDNANNDEFTCEFNTENMTIKFTPLLPSAYTINFYYKQNDTENEKVSSTKTITTNPISFDDIEIGFNSTQLSIIKSGLNKYTTSLNYDDMSSDITIDASIESYKKYIDSKYNNAIYSWSISKFDYAVQGQTLTLKKDDIISAGDIKATCSIYFTDSTDDTQTTISAEVTIKITTSTPILAIKNNSGITSLKSGTSNMSTDLSLKLLTSEEYTAVWFRKTPNSTNYLKVKDGKNYTVDLLNEAPQTNGYGTYSYIAVATTSTTNTVYVSEPIQISINASDYSQTTKYYVKKESITNSRSDAEAFRLTLMTENGETIYLDQTKIVWVVVGTNTNSVIGTGLSAVFEPQTSGTYIVDVKLNSDTGESRSILTDGRIQIVSTVNAIYKIILWVGISIAAMGIVLTISIIITTKKREIIW